MSADDIATLRLWLSDPEDARQFFDDPTLQAMIDRAADLYAAAAEGWRIKAGHVAEWYDVNIDGRGLSREQVFRHCIRMADYYMNSGTGEIRSIAMSTASDTDESEIA